MASHWLFRDVENEFAEGVATTIAEAAADLARFDARVTLGDEHDQCQHLFTKVYTLLQSRAGALSRMLLRSTNVRDPVVELRYYRSKVRRTRREPRAQFVEADTGADFAFTLAIDLPDLLKAERSVLGQAKILGDRGAAIEPEQLQQLRSVAGPESGTYLLWGEGVTPTIVSAENIAAALRTNGTNRVPNTLPRAGKPLSEFFCDSFVGLWFGKDYDPQREQEEPPSTSVGVLYHFLHRGVPPPNVVFFGIGNAGKLGVAPGVYVQDIIDIPS
jgi:hypothetical protein